jgi:type II secretory pathway component PulC
MTSPSRFLRVVLAIGVLLCMPHRGEAQSATVAQEWVVRGIVITPRARSAVLEHGPSGRQEFITVGGSVTTGAMVVAIDPDRVVLDAGGGERITLPLSHGGETRVVRRRAGPRAAPIVDRSRSRTPRYR